MVDTIAHVPNQKEMQVRTQADCHKPEAAKINYGAAHDLIVVPEVSAPAILGDHTTGGVFLYEDKPSRLGAPLPGKVRDANGEPLQCKKSELTGRYEINGGEGVDELRFMPQGQSDHLKASFALQTENNKLVLKHLPTGTEYVLNQVENVTFGTDGRFNVNELMEEAINPANIAISQEVKKANRIVQGR